MSSSLQIQQFGYTNNDTHLFKAVGLKVAMGNATPLLKSHADVVCNAVNDDGLAEFIQDMVVQN